MTTPQPDLSSDTNLLEAFERILSQLSNSLLAFADLLPPPPELQPQKLVIQAAADPVFDGKPWWKEKRAHRVRKHRGNIAELKFLLKGACRRLGLAKPYADSFPYDWIVIARKLYRVQVKATTVHRNEVYSVIVDRDGRRYKKGDFEFLAVLVIPHDAWYIIPFSALGGRSSIKIHTKASDKTGPFSRFYERWDLFE